MLATNISTLINASETIITNESIPKEERDKVKVAISDFMLEYDCYSEVGNEISNAVESIRKNL